MPYAMMNRICQNLCWLVLTRRPRPAGAVMIFTRPAVAIMIFTLSRNAATGDNSMYCMNPDLPSSAFGKGSATPD